MNMKTLGTQENNDMREVVIIQYKGGTAAIFPKAQTVCTEILQSKDAIEEIDEGTIHSSCTNEQKCTVLVTAYGKCKVYANNDAALLDFLLVDFDIIDESYEATYYEQ